MISSQKLFGLVLLISLRAYLLPCKTMEGVFTVYKYQLQFPDQMEYVEVGHFIVPIELKYGLKEVEVTLKI